MLFLGSGISTVFDKPTTIQFRERLLEDFSDPMKDGILHDLLRYPEFLDIEYVLETVRQLLRCSKDNLTNLFSDFSGSPPVRSSFGNPIQELESINKRIEDYVFDYYKWDSIDDEKLTNLYTEIFTFLRKQSNSLVVATTNYDRAIERFCYITEYNYYDGFRNEKNRFVWKDNNFYLPSELNPETDIVLLKLHGSLNWRETSDKVILREEQESRPSDKNYQSSLIYPTLSPKNFENEEPYKTLLKEFTNNLEKADICIVIGYSFRDSTFCKMLKSFVLSDKLLVVVGKNSQKIVYKQMFDVSPMIDPENTAIVNYLPKGSKYFGHVFSHLLTVRRNSSNPLEFMLPFEDTVPRFLLAFVTSSLRILSIVLLVTLLSVIYSYRGKFHLSAHDSLLRSDICPSLPLVLIGT
jgi:hypothetical protein